MPQKLITIAKFLTFLIILPVIFTATLSFGRQLENLNEDLSRFFVIGIATYLVLHLFIFNPNKVFQFGQRFVAHILRFFPKAEAVVVLVLPFYAVCILVLALFNSVTLKMNVGEPYILFCVGFALMMHVLQTSEGLKSSELGGSAHYFFTFGLSYLTNLMIISVLLHVMFPAFSFPEFFQVMGSEAGAFYSSVFDMLFAV